MSRPTNCRYAESHEWVRKEGDVAVIGITDYAVKALRDLVALDIEQRDGDIEKGDTFGVIESVKAASDLYTPVSGKVISVNETLEGDVDSLAKDAFQNGWMIKIKMSDPKQLDTLLTSDAYEKFLQTHK